MPGAKSDMSIVLQVGTMVPFFDTRACSGTKHDAGITHFGTSGARSYAQSGTTSTKIPFLVPDLVPLVSSKLHRLTENKSIRLKMGLVLLHRLFWYRHGTNVWEAGIACN
ncbi:hypothetical protein [Candidatus Nitrososphaera gargensis]|uniref:hypothetical protein n=1 Tax=Candidatus Nitrososphaera gargensis TaxID=497727 RepID=UPI0011E5261C|nr:hypothetical protein [Candidatus Nitrososphaera gargensis]